MTDTEQNQFETRDAKTWKERFLQKILLKEQIEKKEDHFNVITASTYNKLIGEVQDAELAAKKTPLQQRRIKRFKVVEVGEIKKLASRNDPVKYYVPAEDIFDLIEAAHVAIGHGGRDRLKAETGRKYANITIDMINTFISMCETCQRKKSKKKRGLVSKPILHSEMNSRCQVDLVDMQSQEDRGYKFIMVYQDHLTKFILLRPLKSKRAEEVAYQLTDIFLTFGAPCILHSDNGREFVNGVINEVVSYWPEVKLVHGKPRHSQSQGSVERANQDVEKMLASWMQDNNTTNWSKGLAFVQFMKNRALHSGIKQSPYRAMFGIEPRVGLSTSSLPSEIIAKIADEEDLQKVIQEINSENYQQHISAAVEDAAFKEDHQTVAARKQAYENLKKQAKKMKLVSDSLHPPVEKGDNVILPIPDVDRAKADLRNIIGVVLEKNEEGLHKIGTKHGIVEKLYCRYVHA